MCNKQLDWSIPKTVRGNGIVNKIHIRNNSLKYNKPWVVTVVDKHGRIRETDVYATYEEARDTAHDWLALAELM